MHVDRITDDSKLLCAWTTMAVQYCYVLSTTAMVVCCIYAVIIWVHAAITPFTGVHALACLEINPFRC